MTSISPNSNSQPLEKRIANPVASVSGKNSTPAPGPASSGSRSYANATKASTETITPSTTVHSQHGIQSSVHVKSKTSMQNSSNSVSGGLTIVNGSTTPNPMQGDHGRKPSVTISAAGTTGYIANGGPTSSRPTNLQFGAVNPRGSPAAGPHAVLANQSHSSLGVGQAGSRGPSPHASPSPIPQTLASGGPLPSSLHASGNSLNFIVPDADQPTDINRAMRPAHSNPLGPTHQSTHLRRESSQSTHSDIGPGVQGSGGRPYHQPGGRGRNYGQGHQPHVGYGSPNSTYRSHPAPRGGPNIDPRTNPQGRSYPFSNSPHQSAASPAMSNAHPVSAQVPSAQIQPPQMHPQPGFNGYPPPIPQQVKQQFPKFSNRNHSSPMKHHPHFNPSIYPAAPNLPVESHLPPPSLNLSPESGNFEQFLTKYKSQGYVPNPYEHAYYYPTPPSYPMQQHIPSFVPPSPRATYLTSTHPPFMPNQFVPQSHQLPQTTPLSRSSSQVSATDRPASSLGQGQQQTGSATQSHSHSASRSTSSPVPPHFVVPSKKNSTLIIRDPGSGNVIKPSGSPARPASTTVKSGTTPVSTPPPPSRGDQDPSDLKNQSGEEKKQSFQNAIVESLRLEKEAEEQRLLAQRNPEESATDKKNTSQPSPAKSSQPPEANQDADSVKQPQRTKTEEEEIDFDAIERELAEKEAAEAAAEEEYQKRKQKNREEEARKAKDEADASNLEMKKAEAEAEAIEQERLQKLAATETEAEKKERQDLFAALKGKNAFTPPTHTPDAATPAASGAATPVSDISMGPPPPKQISGKREKPASLKIETNKQVEPPQPSAAMKSLHTARFLEDPSRVSYPPSVVSPNPALNASAPSDRKFKYNKEFLLQFQNVFKEKPSIDWDTRVRETVGDGAVDSARSQSSRTLGRNPSNRGAPPTQHNMGTFPIPNKIQSLPQPSVSRGPGAGTMQFGNFGRQVGLPMGHAMVRNSSSSALHQMPGSPRSGSHRGTRTASKAHKTKKDDEGNKVMPLTAGAEIKPLISSTTGWKPRVGKHQQTVGPDGHLPPDVVQGKVKSNLNKMTPQNFDKISSEILAIVAQSKNESDGRTLRQVIQLTFEKATDEAHWASMYARFCMCMLETISPEIRDEKFKDKQGNTVAGGSLFRKYLLNRCQEEFEKGWKVNLPEQPEGSKEEASMLSEEYYIAAAVKRRGLGLVKFIGELYKMGMLTERIMHDCVKRLVDYDGTPDEAEVESLSSLLRTIGANLDNSEKGHGLMDAYFVRIQMMIETTNLSSRHKFMLMDIVDLRKHKWVSKDADKGPKTITEIREAAIRAQQEQELERARQQANRGNAGRMALGRGDARNFSSGYGTQAPPPDYASSKVGSDDLRRLKASRSTNQPASFSPSGLLGSRSSSRRNLGPGGNLVRGGDDSGASSRTGTPPAGRDKKDEKEAASSTNAFSALASLDAGDSLATSPPSNPPSPQLIKSRPNMEQSRPSPKDDGATSAS